MLATQTQKTPLRVIANKNARLGRIGTDLAVRNAGRIANPAARVQPQRRSPAERVQG